MEKGQRRLDDLESAWSSAGAQKWPNEIGRRMKMVGDVLFFYSFSPDYVRAYVSLLFLHI